MERRGRSPGRLGSLTGRRRCLYAGARMDRRYRSPGNLLFLAFGLFVVLGHVCALPADAADLAALVGHGHAPHDEGQADGAVHVDSCEVVRPFTDKPSMPAVTSTTPARLVTHIVPRLFDAAPAIVAPSPP